MKELPAIKVTSKVDKQTGPCMGMKNKSYKIIQATLVNIHEITGWYGEICKKYEQSDNKTKKKHSSHEKMPILWLRPQAKMMPGLCKNMHELQKTQPLQAGLKKCYQRYESRQIESQKFMKQSIVMLSCERVQTKRWTELQTEKQSNCSILIVYALLL